MDNEDNRGSLGDIMTLADVSRYLKVAEKTVLRLVHRREIPCAKVGNQWRFLKPVLDDWLSAKMQVVPRNDLARLIAQGNEAVLISRIIRREFIVPDLEPGSKQDVLRQLIAPLADRGILTDPAGYLEKLVARENMASTAVGNGVALPHLRNPGENPVEGPLMIMGLCRRGTDFDSVDGGKIHLFFVASSDSETVHLRMLASLTRLLRNSTLVEELRECRDACEIIGAFVRAETEERADRTDAGGMR